MKKLAWGSIPARLLFLALAVVVAPTAADAQDEQRLRGNDVAVYNLAGHVEVVSGSGSDVVVQIMRGGSDARDLEVEVFDVDGREALVIRYPSDNVVYSEMGRNSRTQMRVRDDGTWGGRSGGRGDEVEIRGSGRGMEAWADLRISVPRGKDVAVYVAVGEVETDGVEGDLMVDTGSGAVHSRGGSGSLNVDTGSGAVTVRDFDGNVEVDTGSGSVEIDGIRGDEVSVDTGSGSVVGGGITASVFVVDTGSGQIEIARVSAPEVHLDTGSGSVEVELMEDVDELVVDTGSGGVTIRVPANLGAEFELDSGSGGIDMDIPMEVRSVRRNHMRGVLGDGRGSISVDTGSGRIRIIGGRSIM